MKKSFFAGVLLSAVSVFAEVVPSGVFNDNMVLQRNKSVPVWGKAAPGETVTVTFAGQRVSTQADKSGKWLVRLAEMKENAHASELVIKGSDNTVVIKNVLVGEVWLASGQSNMAMHLKNTFDAGKYAQAGANKLIRIAVTGNSWGQRPRDLCYVKWQELDAQNSLSFSAVAFHFAQKIYKELNVPVGIVSSSWGGSRIEPWIPPCGFNSVKELSEFSYVVNAKIPGTDEYKKIVAETGKSYTQWLQKFDEAVANGAELPVPPDYPAELKPYPNRQHPTVIYNNLIHPMRFFAFRGIIWYQGCSNHTEGMLYKHKMQALLNGWRQIFQQPDLPLYYVQIAPFRYGGSPYKLPEFWEAQQAFADSTPDDVNMAVINDIGEYNDIHPREKKTVGDRLGLLALKYTYKKNVKADSPKLASWKIEGNKFILTFKYVEKFVSKGKIANFEIADATGNWVEASVTANGNVLTVSAEKIKEPYQLRYMWHQTRTGNLYNEANLPLGAFRCGRTADKTAALKTIENTMHLIYEHDPRKPTPQNGTIKYLVDNSDKFKGKVKRIAYVWNVIDKSGKEEYLIAFMDAFTDDVKKIGVPVAAAGIEWAKVVKNVTVFSNVTNLRTGYIDECSIEFWSRNYVPRSTNKVPKADSSKYDFCDTPQGNRLGYGCMQLHNFKAKQTIFAYNAFRSKSPDLGFGNSAHRQDATDWTFAANVRTLKKASLKIYVAF